MSTERTFTRNLITRMVNKEDYKGLLGHLLAVIHRDGGQYTELAGLHVSLEDAFAKVFELHRESAALKARERV